MSNKKQEAMGQRLKISRLFSHPEKLIGEADNFLAKLFRIYLVDQNIGLERFNAYVGKWINNPIYGFLKDPSKRSSARGNLNKEILRPNMSPDVFLKAMAAMGNEDVEIVMRTRRNGRDTWTEHAISINKIPEIVAATMNEGGIENDDTDDGNTGGEETGYRRKGANSQETK